MRLPWIQLSSDGVRRAKMAGVLMGIGEHAGVGFVAALWMTALELAPDGDFSGNVEDASVLVSGAGGIPAGCASDAGGVVSILQRVGLVATVPTLRVRGLDRYRSAWLKNSKSRGRPPETETEPKRKIKTEKKTETDTSRNSRELHPLQKLWNDLAPETAPRWTTTGDARKRAADARLSEHGTDDFWFGLFAKCKASDFLAGRKTDFVVTPDWLLKPANLTKVLEGNYDNRGPAKASLQQITTWTEDDDPLVGLGGVR